MLYKVQCHKYRTLSLIWKASVFIPEEGTLPDFFPNSSVFCLYIWFIFCCLWLLQLYIAVLRFPVVQLVYYIVGFVSGVISPYYKFFFLSTKIFFAKILIFATFALPVFWEAQKSRSGYGLYGNLRLTLFPYMPVAGSHRYTFRLLTSGLLAPGSAENALVLYAVSSSLQVITSSAN